MRFTALRRVRPYIRPYDRQMITMMIAALSGLGAATIVPLVIKRVIDGPVAHHRPHAIWALVALALALGTLEALAASLRRYVLSHAALGMETALRNDVYAHLQKLPVSFHDRWQSGQLLSRAMADVSTIRRFVGFGLIFLVVNTATFLLVVGLLVTLYWPLAIVVALSAIPIVLLSWQFERQYMKVSRLVQDQVGDLTTRVEEAATGIRVTKAFGRARLLGDLYTEQARTLRNSTLQRVRLLGRFWAAIDAVPNLTMAVILLGGAMAVSRGAMTIGGLIAFISLVLMLIWPVDALGWILGTAEEAETAAARIWEVFDTEPEIAERPGAVSVRDNAPGHVRFEGVAFAYPDTTKRIIRGVDLEICPGETVALVGMTGAGKTTLASLVPRLHDVSAGRITVDGVDIQDLKLTSLRRHVAVAFEEPILFSASVRENLLLGWPDASDADLDRAIDVAQAGFVRDLPWGLDTRVGEQGLTLSGGQRQRLALARAIVGRPQVLVLDDPLSALDVHTEALVEEALRRVLAGVTALVVVHRPSTVALADRVALLDGGRITHVGTHTELLAVSPTYRAILAQEADDPRPTVGGIGRYTPFSTDSSQEKAS